MNISLKSLISSITICTSDGTSSINSPISCDKTSVTSHNSISCLMNLSATLFVPPIFSQGSNIAIFFFFISSPLSSCFFIFHSIGVYAPLPECLLITHLFHSTNVIRLLQRRSEHHPQYIHPLRLWLRLPDEHCRQ